MGDKLNVTISKAPSLKTVQGYTRYRPETLSDTKLMSLYAKVAVMFHVLATDRAPSSYYGLSAYGPVILDMWLNSSLRYAKEEYYKEIVKRGLQDSFCVWDEIQKA